MSCPVAGFCFYCFHQMSLWVGVEALQTDPLSEADNLQLLVTGGGGAGVLLSNERLGGTLLDGREKGRRTLQGEH